MRPVLLSEQTTISVYSTKCLVFLYEQEIEFLNNFSIFFVLQRVSIGRQSQYMNAQPINGCLGREVAL
jgi:hypothetical protein